ncbi:hypothetical protein K7472_08095 [Streptomyces sp. PTM05]|uniref:Uncharacterized protein n=1 Tax=Streptantibioticus parmotrematis TaxID=2873249 RepID=A0ABS7QPY2_9ACTN|nr:hypothetical protein [Streptantibioticus parmotrematis]MBY8884806.1 hypothetical protein [Streptantibioticus parmotrematis]
MNSNTDTQTVVRNMFIGCLDRRTQWDEPPEILIVTQAPGGNLIMGQLPLPAGLWEVAPPPFVLANYAHLAHATRVRPVRGLVAVAFRCEAFAISPDVSPEAAEALRRRNAGGSAPPNKDIPGRVEQRVISAVDIEGHDYMITADRRDDGTATAAVCTMHRHGARHTGRVPDAVNSLLAALRPRPASGQDRLYY